MSSTGYVTEELETAIRNACTEILEDELRSNVVGVADLEESSAVVEAADVSDAAIRTRIGRVMKQAEFAEKVARNKYRIYND